MDRVSVRPLATAEIIAVGTEMLGTTRLDTNSLFLAGRLGDLGDGNLPAATTSSAPASSSA